MLVDEVTTVSCGGDGKTVTEKTKEKRGTGREKEKVSPKSRNPPTSRNEWEKKGAEARKTALWWTPTCQRRWARRRSTDQWKREEGVDEWTKKGERCPEKIEAINREKREQKTKARKEREAAKAKKKNERAGANEKEEASRRRPKVKDMATWRRRRNTTVGGRGHESDWLSLCIYISLW